MGKQNFYRGLAEVVGWISAVLFVLGAVSARTGQELLASGNDHWQAALYLALFALFASRMSRA